MHLRRIARRFSRWPSVFERLVQISIAIIAELFRRIERFAFRNGEISSIIHVLLKCPEEGDSYVHISAVAQVIIVANICHVTAITMLHHDTAVNSSERERTWAS